MHCAQEDAETVSRVRAEQERVATAVAVVLRAAVDVLVAIVKGGLKRDDMLPVR